MLHYGNATIPPVLVKINFQNMQVAIGIQRANMKENENDIGNLCAYELFSNRHLSKSKITD